MLEEVLRVTEKSAQVENEDAGRGLRRRLPAMRSR